MSRLIKSTSTECRVYVGNLPQFVKNRDLEDMFDKFGVIKAIDLHSKFDPAFAFIEFEDPRDAEDAVYDKDGEKYEGQRLKVQFPRSNSGGGPRRSDFGSSSSRGSGGSGGSGSGSYVQGRGRGAPIRRSENRALVSGLPPTGSWQDLKDHMREAGDVLYADVYKDGTAVVEFSKHDDMKWAVKYLDDTKFKSHENETTFIRVKRDGAQSRSRSRSPPKRGRSRSPSRSRSRSRSPRRRYSRSRSRSPRRRSRSRSRSRSQRKR